MRVPFSWLCAWTPVAESAEAVADRLTGAGLETHVVEWLGHGVQGVWVATVESVAFLSGSDHLRRVVLCVSGKRVNVLTGADNVRVGDRVPWIEPGGQLADGRKIERRIMRGEPSDGMLLSATELGLGDDPDGILRLEPELAEGQDVRVALHLPDPVLEVELTPNLGHCLSIRGVARELAAVTLGALNPLPSSLPVIEAALGQRIGEVDPSAASQYFLMDTKGDPMAATPPLVRRRLLSANVRLHGLLVDVTNYVLWDLGQPLHAFDRRTLVGDQLSVRRARSGERLRTLDGEERILSPDVWLVADGEGPVAVAGVIGGKNSEISQKSGVATLEAATFLPDAIRRSSRALHLRTDASQRFSRGVDPKLAQVALGQASALLEQAGWTVADRAVGVSSKRSRQVVEAEPSRIAALLGADFSKDEMRRALERLQFEVAQTASGAFSVTVPTFRYDIGGESDLAEEVGRVLSLDRIPERLPHGELTLAVWPSAMRREEALVDRCLAAGLSEAVTSSLVSGADLAITGELEGPPVPVRLANPLSPEEDTLRPSFLVPLAEAARTNLARGAAGAWLVDRGAVYWRERGEAAEERALACLLVGPPGPEDWHSRLAPADVYTLKGIVESLLEDVLGHAFQQRPLHDPRFHPGRQCAYEVDGEPVAVLGELHPRVAQGLRLPERVLYSEWSLGRTVSCVGVEARRDPARYPSAVRDVAVVLPDELPAGQVLDEVHQAAGSLCEEVKIFDVYRKEPIPKGHRSLALTLRYRAPDHTLTDAEVSETHEQVREALQRLGGELRS